MYIFIAKSPLFGLAGKKEILGIEIPIMIATHTVDKSEIIDW